MAMSLARPDFFLPRNPLGIDVVLREASFGWLPGATMSSSMTDLSSCIVALPSCARPTGRPCPATLPWLGARGTCPNEAEAISDHDIALISVGLISVVV